MLHTPLVYQVYEELPRRSLTIFDENHNNLQKIRGKVLMKGLEMDYTTGLNMALQWGIFIIDALTDLDQPLVWQGIKSYIDDPKIKEIGYNDQLRDKFDKSIEEIVNKATKKKN